MARSFASASSQYLEKTGLSFASPPYTITCWFKCSSFADRVLVSIDRASLTHIFEMYSTSGSKLGYYVEQPGVGFVSLVGSTSLSTGTWYHGAATMNVGDHQLWLNGASEGTSASGTATGSCDQLHIGANRYNGTVGSFLNGQVAEVGIWQARLTTAEVASLAKGYTPLEIRPASLVAYYPLGGHYGQFDLDRWKNRYDLTPSGSPTWADHPRVFYPRRSFWFPSPLPAAPTSYTLEALPATVDVVGQSASLSAVRRITAQPATIEVVGQAATLRVVRKLVASPSTVDVVGQSATLTRARTLTANAAEVQVSGQAAGLTATRKITASPAAIEVVGQSANLRVVRRIVASPATVEVSGQTAVTRRTALLQGLAATIAVVGQAAVLTYSGEAAVVTEDWIGVDKATGRTPKATATHRVGTATAIGRVSKATAYQRPQ